VCVGMVVLLPIAILVTPEVLRLASLGGSSAANPAGELGVARLLVAMLMPQILFYGVIGTATAVQNAYRRFALPAAAPVLENVGTIAVLVLVRFLFPPVRSFANVPLAELLLLGLGSTAAVGIHAAVQWWGARRVGVTLRPRVGWRNPEVRVVMRRGVPSLVQAGAAALQLIVLLVPVSYTHLDVYKRQVNSFSKSSRSMSRRLSFGPERRRSNAGGWSTSTTPSCDAFWRPLSLLLNRHPANESPTMIPLDHVQELRLLIVVNGTLRVTRQIVTTWMACGRGTTSAENALRARMSAERRPIEIGT